jgi:hypothetical protein
MTTIYDKEVGMVTNITTWTSLIQPFLLVFTQPGGAIFTRLTVGWILCTVRRTVTGMLPFADSCGEQAHDAFHRFFPDARWSMAKLWRILTSILIKTFCRTGTITLALDDTLFHHSGKKVNGAGYWRDAVRSTRTRTVYAWGLNLVVLTLQIQTPWGGEPLGLPINMRLHHKGGATLIELAQEMIDEVVQWFPKSWFLVVADGFFATLAGKHLLNTTVISRIQRNAEIYDLPTKPKKQTRGRPRKKGKRLPCPEKMAKRIGHWQKVEVCERGKSRIRLVYSKVLLWYRVSQRPMLLVISRDPAGKEKDDFFITTDVTMSPDEVIGCYADRWAIEDTFKNTKQYLGGQEPQTFKGKGPERAAGLSLLLYSMVWLWYLLQKGDKRYFIVHPWNPLKSMPSFADAIACLRRELWAERIKCMFGVSVVHDKKLQFLLEALAPAA